MHDSLTATPLDISVLKWRTAANLKSWVFKNPSDSLPQIGTRILPQIVGQVALGEPRALCVGPREWLLVSDAIASLEAHVDIQRQAAEQQLAVVEVSQGLKTLNVRGPGCREVLAKGCGLDLHSRVFREDACARTLLAQVLVVLDCRGPQEFDVYVGRSYMWHLHTWLVDASMEYRRTIE
jgi:sarcosine oxidase subunit gamma